MVNVIPVPLSPDDPFDALSGRYYDTWCNVPMTGTITLVLVADRLYAQPVWTGDTGWTANKIGVNVTAAAAAGKLFRFSVYANKGGGFLPDVLLLDAGTAPADPGAPPAEETATISLTLPPRRWVWPCVHCNGTPTVTAFSTPFIAPRGRLNGAAGTRRGVMLYQTLAFGAAPSPFGAITDDAQTVCPAVFLVAA